jgi:TP901 family phage tail tape measure protein
MSANATAKVTVALLDRLSAPAQIVRNSLRGIAGDMKSLSGARIGLTKQIEEMGRRASEARSKLLALGTTGLIAGYGLAKVVKPATSFETVMLDIAQKANLTDAAMKSLGARIVGIGPKVNRSTSEVAKGVDFLLGMGMDIEKAMTITPSIGKAATAYRAQIEDLSKASFSVIDNMKVLPEQMRKTLDVMTQAGLEGGFELKDMAREFPSLTASAEALGIKGVAGVAKLAAALQIARKGAADGSEAATNTANLMQKIISPETTKKFKKVGIDIRKELKKTQDAGGDPFVMVAELVKKATKGDIAKIGDFFEDAQVQKFLRPLIAQLDEYKRIRDKAGAADGVVDQDYARRVNTFQAAIDRTMAAFERLGIAVGTALIPSLNLLADKVGAFADWAARMSAEYSTLVAAVTGVTAGLLALGGAVAVFRLAMAGLSIFGLKGLRGFLNYLAPKGKPSVVDSVKPAARMTGAKPATTPGSTVPSVRTPGSTTTVTTPSMMTPAQIVTAQKAVSSLNVGATTKLLNRLKGGLIGGAIQYGGETLIDKFLDALPSPTLPAGYDPKAEMNMSSWDRLKRLTGSGDGAQAKTRPLSLDDAERSRRVADEMKRDPEGARGRAMAQRDAVSDASVGADSRASGLAAGADVGQGIKEGLAGARSAILAEVGNVVAEARSMLASAGLTMTITPKLAGAGAALRGIHADNGIGN